jgi:hypothetical protein
MFFGIAILLAEKEKGRPEIPVGPNTLALKRIGIE